MSDAYSNLGTAWLSGGLPSQGKTTAIRALSPMYATAVDVADATTGLDWGRFPDLESSADVEDIARLLEEAGHEIDVRHRLLAALPRR